MPGRTIKLTVPVPPSTNNIYGQMTLPPKAPTGHDYKSAADQERIDFEHKNRSIKGLLQTFDWFVAGFLAGVTFERSLWMPLTEERPKSLRFPTEALKDFKATVAEICEAAAFEPFDCDVVFKMTVFRPRKVGDTDGYLKSAIDSLTGYAYHDDKQVASIQIDRDDDKTNPRAEIEIFEAESEEQRLFQ